MDFPPPAYSHGAPQRPFWRRAGVAWTALVVSWAIGGAGIAAYLTTRPAVPARVAAVPAASAAPASSSAAAAAEAAASDAEAAAQAAPAAPFTPVAENDPSLDEGPWWLSQRSKPGGCTDTFNPAGALYLGGDLARANRDPSGNLISVEIHMGGAVDTHLTFFRDKATCDALRIAQFKRDCERVNAEGYGVDCDALARQDPGRVAQVGDPQ